MGKKQKLSNKPSTILLQALEDLEAVEKSKKIEINMDYWVIGKGKIDYTKAYEKVSKKCQVCHAGACMVQRYGAPLDESVSIEAYDRKTDAKFRFINAVRLGNVAEGLKTLADNRVISYEKANRVRAYFYDEDFEDEYSTSVIYIPADVEDFKGKKARRQYKEYIQFVAGMLKAEGL